MCIEEGITCIPLDHWTDKERTGSGPDPTPHGAQVLANYIQEHVLLQIQKEEGHIVETQQIEEQKQIIVSESG